MSYLWNIAHKGLFKQWSWQSLCIILFNNVLRDFVSLFSLLTLVLSSVSKDAHLQKGNASTREYSMNPIEIKAINSLSFSWYYCQGVSGKEGYHNTRNNGLWSLEGNRHIFKHWGQEWIHFALWGVTIWMLISLLNHM